MFQEYPGISREFPRIIPGNSRKILSLCTNIPRNSREFSELYWKRNKLRILMNSREVLFTLRSDAKSIKGWLVHVKEVCWHDFVK